MDGVDSPDGDLKARGFAKGALRFARGEGLAVGTAAGRTAAGNAGQRERAGVVTPVSG